MAAKKKTFPSQVFIFIDGDPGEEFLVVEEDGKEFLPDGKVGVYELVEVLTAKNTVQLT